MAHPIIIIGSGFAALQTVKMLHRSGCADKIELFTSGDGSEYNKPDLSHVFSKNQMPEELPTKTAAELSQQYGVTIHAHHLVKDIDHEAHTIRVNDQFHTYSKLIIATGSSAFIPPIEGINSNRIVTLNSLDEFAASKSKVDEANSVSVIGGGLIGVELALDLAKAGKKVTIVEPTSHLLSSLIPEFVATELLKALSKFDINVLTNNYVVRASETNNGMTVTTNQGLNISCDIVLSAAGVRPNIKLAAEAGIATNRGIVVDDAMRTSAPDVYAVGDCAEIHGRVLAFLQPAIMSANVIASQLGGGSATLNLPTMLVKVKTPEYPIQLAGNSMHDITRWSADMKTDGMVIKSYDPDDNFVGFICTGEHAKMAFPMLRELHAS
ncbi:NADH:flavorubredoxin reductase NorW [Photobacterium sp. DNB22_13_2]